MMMADRYCGKCRFFSQIVAGTKDLPYGFCRKRSEAAVNSGYSNGADNFVQMEAACEDFKAKSLAQNATGALVLPPP